MLVLMQCTAIHSSSVLSWTRTRYLVFESEHESGGHFPAHEKPEKLVGDLRRMFGRSGGAFGVVKGKYGYASR